MIYEVVQVYWVWHVLHTPHVGVQKQQSVFKRGNAPWFNPIIRSNSHSWGIRDIGKGDNAARYSH